MEKQTKDKSTSTMVKQGNATVSVKENQPSTTAVTSGWSDRRPGTIRISL
jgi:hypothetical protein